MPFLYATPHHQLGPLIAQLQQLGGRARVDFAIVYDRFRVPALDVSDELYHRWTGQTTAAHQPSNEPTPPEPESDVTTASPPIPEWSAPGADDSTDSDTSTTPRRGTRSTSGTRRTTGGKGKTS